MTLTKLMVAYRNIISVDVDRYTSGVRKLRLPSIPEDLMIEILETSIEVFRSNDTVISLDGTVCIVGDIHGQLLDLFRIFQTQGLPPLKDYLFLGDFVDRGEFSLETITLILLLKILFPSNVNVIRGNHEFASMSETGGFFKELHHVYNSDGIRNLFEEMYSYLPIAAVVGDMMLCVHGGIGPNLTHFDQLRQIERPITSLELEGTLTDLFWSDPINEPGFYKASKRGLGHLFGEGATKSFLSTSNFKFIVRGHECVPRGYATMHSNRVITVFSASNYCMEGNQGAILNVIENFGYEPVYFDPLPSYRRMSATFVPIERLCKNLLQRKKTVPAVTIRPLLTGVHIKSIASSRRRRPSDSPIALSTLSKNVRRNAIL